MAYNPHKIPTPIDQLTDLPFLVIKREPSDLGADWLDCYDLIEKVLRRDEDVADCAVDFDGQTVHVCLSGEGYDLDDLERIDMHLRRQIGKVASFNFGAQQE